MDRVSWDKVIEALKNAGFESNIIWSESGLSDDWEYFQMNIRQIIECPTCKGDSILRRNDYEIRCRKCGWQKYREQLTTSE